MSSAEQKFLENREKRERARLAVVKDHQNSSECSDHHDLLKELTEYEQNVEAAIARGDATGAGEKLLTLRQLIQDGAATETLTAYEMGKANSTVSRLTDVIQSMSKSVETGSSGSPTASSSGPRSGAANPGTTESIPKKKFQFKRAPVREEASPPVALGDHGSKDLPGKSEVTEKIVGESYGSASNTTVFVPSSRALFLRDCHGCDVFVLPVAGSAFVSDFSSCRLYIACKQLRFKNCQDVEVYAWVSSTPIIEQCDNMRFGPYTCWRGLLGGPVPVPSHVQLGSDAENNAQKTYFTHKECVDEIGEACPSSSEKEGSINWQRVDDFQWLKKTQSPHWRCLLPNEYNVSDTLFAFSSKS